MKTFNVDSQVIGLVAILSQYKSLNPLSSAGRMNSLLTSQQISMKPGLL